MSGESLVQTLVHLLCLYHDSLCKISLEGLFLEDRDCVLILKCLRSRELSALEKINLLNLKDGCKRLHFPGVSENPNVDEEQGTKCTFFSINDQDRFCSAQTCELSTNFFWGREELPDCRPQALYGMLAEYGLSRHLLTFIWILRMIVSLRHPMTSR